jgi:hypothetical protein
MTHYLQCKLKDGNAELTAWIEERGAKPGARVELKAVPGLWEVTEVYDNVRLGAAVLREMQDMHRGSLPSVKPIGR